MIGVGFFFLLQIKEQGVPLSFKGSPYWMAPEVNLMLDAIFKEVTTDLYYFVV